MTGVMLIFQNVVSEKFGLMLCLIKIQYYWIYFHVDCLSEFTINQNHLLHNFILKTTILNEYSY